METQTNCMETRNRTSGLRDFSKQVLKSDVVTPAFPQMFDISFVPFVIPLPFKDI
jgi:hypothetical protein